MITIAIALAVIEGERLEVRVEKLGKGFSKFGELPWKEQLLFSEAFFLHLTTGLILKVIPFRWIPRLFSSPQSPVSSRQFETPAKWEAQSQHSMSGRQSELIELIKVAVQRAGGFSPWRNKCLVSSLVARRMLKKRKIPSKLSLGVAKDTGGRTVAHAWLIAGGIEIVPSLGYYKEIYQF